MINFGKRLKTFCGISRKAKVICETFEKLHKKLDLFQLNRKMAIFEKRIPLIIKLLSEKSFFFVTRKMCQRAAESM